MIAKIKKVKAKSVPTWHAAFLKMLPAIQRHARVAFRHLDAEGREEAVQETVCNACAAFARLVELDKAELAYPTVLARYAVAQVKDGRKVGGHLNCKDVLSPYCQKKKGLTVERLDKYDTEEDAWQEIVLEDRHAGPAEVACVRLDFAAWLKLLSRRYRRIAKVLAIGETTNAAARRFHVSAGRVSQIRKELKKVWDRFQGEGLETAPALATA